ncbi:hypothetical protein [Sorangium sp. So ce204]|uniref:hypothetical protein n=1 Tax=Sorangium sp. So ce204 TaxID=3133288 RepID=UPI003F60BA27
MFIAWLETKLDAAPALAARVASDAEHVLAGMTAALPEVGLALTPTLAGRLRRERDRESR